MTANIQLKSWSSFRIFNKKKRNNLVSKPTRNMKKILLSTMTQHRYCQNVYTTDHSSNDDDKQKFHSWAITYNTFLFYLNALQQNNM
ncbi:hypothetical protein HanIR_Chr03g0146281 [Helianthus annuus]|nr:hypothetical protein HanIR_Chr03g0146281 [Helianthus annuus]